MKKYENYKPSGVEFIGEIPEHWEVSKLKFMVDRVMGGGTPLTSNSDYWTENKDDGLLWVAIADITKSEYIEKTKKYITEEGLSNSSAHRVEAYSVLYSIYASLGKVAYSPYELTTNQAILAIKTNEKLFYKFLFYYLKTIEDKLPFLSSSTTQNNISLDIVKNFNITQPSYAEQEKIANFLDIKNQQIEEFIKEKQNQIALLEEQKEAIINQAVTKGLDDSVEFKDSGIEWIGDIPEHWNMMKITHLFNKIGSGTTPLTSNSDYYDNGTIYWVNSGDLNNGFIERSSKLITQKAIDEVPSLKMYKQGALIIAMYGATIGKLGILDIKASVNQACCVLDDSSKMIHKFTFFWFLVNKQNIINLGIGGGQPNISQDIIKSLRIQTPPKNEQIKIIKYIETELSKINKVINQIQKEIGLIQEYKISLISEVVTGQIDVR